MKQGKKLLTSVAVLTVALALAVTSTYAWFTMSTKANISGLDVNVTAYDGMQIAVTAKGKTPNESDYKIKIAGAEIVALLAAGFELDAVTTGDGKAFTLRDGTDASFDIVDDGKYDGEYIEFDLHFLADTNYDIVLDFTGADTTAVIATPSSDASLIKAVWWDAAIENYGAYFNPTVIAPVGLKAGNPIEASAANAVRISFDNTTKVNVYEPNHDAGYNGSANLALDYYNYITAQSVTPGAIIATTITSDPEEDATSLVKLSAATGGLTGYRGKVTVRIWIEGWDGDALNSILKDKLTVNLKFNATMIAEESGD